jgi:hypothetical protein
VERGSVGAAVAGMEGQTPPLRGDSQPGAAVIDLGMSTV